VLQTDILLVLGVEGALVELAMLVIMVADAISDPVIGHISDSWQSRWGGLASFVSGLLCRCQLVAALGLHGQIWPISPHELRHDLPVIPPTPGPVD
jgi:hypothetical protein